MEQWFECLGAEARILSMAIVVFVVVTWLVLTYIYWFRHDGCELPRWAKVFAWIGTPMFGSLLAYWLIVGLYQMITCL